MSAHTIINSTTQTPQWVCIILKFIILAVLCFIIYKLTYSSPYSSTTENNNETFVNNIEEEKKQYLKFNETYLDTFKRKTKQGKQTEHQEQQEQPENTTLQLLYANYNGDEVGTEKWNNKTLDQCIDTCNKLENCAGFSRDLVNDTESATCYPRTQIDKCYSNRKGNFQQRQHALSYNTYVKSTVNGALTKCLGDANLTLGRPIFIKSHAYPNKYVGINTANELVLLDRNETMNNGSHTFFNACKFKIDAGFDGSGTVSIKHVSSGKYIYRDSNDMISAKSVSSIASTDEKQRASFHIYDGVSNQIIFKCTPLQLENSERFISIYKNNHKYLNVITANSNDNTNSNIDTNFKTESNSNTKIKNKKMLTFEIVDNIISSTILDNKKYIADAVSPIPTAGPMDSPNKILATPEGIPSQKCESFDDAPKSIPQPTTLDVSTDNYKYYNILGGDNNSKDLTNFVQDTYINNPSQYAAAKFNYNLSQKFNNYKAKSSLNNISAQNKTEYDTLQSLNKDIETQIAKQNIDIDKKSNKLINNIDKMKIQEMSSDYYFLQNLTNPTQY